MKFKVGDRVKFNKSLPVTEGCSRHWADDDFVDGQMQTVTEVTFSGDAIYLDSQRKSIGYNSQQFELVEEAPETWSIKGDFANREFFFGDLAKEVNKIMYAGDTPDMWYNCDGKKVSRQTRRKYKKVTLEWLKSKYSKTETKMTKATWSIAGSPENKEVFIELLSSINERGYHGDAVSQYYNFNGKEITGYSATPDYPIVDLGFIKNNYLSTKASVEKKQIGWKLKDEFKKNEANIAASLNCISPTLMKIDSQGSNFMMNSSNAVKAKELGILELWFEPVFEKKENPFKVGDYIVCLGTGLFCGGMRAAIGGVYKIKELGEYNGRTKYMLEGKDTDWFAESDGYNLRDYVRFATKEEIAAATTKTLTLGDKKTVIKISKGKIEAEGKTVDIEDLKRINTMMNASVMLVGSWSVSYPFIKIGCSQFSATEIATIVSEYTKLNK